MTVHPYSQFCKILCSCDICRTLGVIILIILITCLPVSGYIIPDDIQSRLKTAFPTAAEATSGLDFSQDPKISHEDSQDNYYYVTYSWKGYSKFTCPANMKDGRIDKNPKDFFSADISLFYIDNAASALTLTSAEVFRDWIKGRVEPYTDYQGLPGGVIHEKERDTEFYHDSDDWIAFWYDPHTYCEIRVSASIHTNPLYDTNGCLPSVQERKGKMQSLARSEAERLASLVYSRLSGKQSGEPASDKDLATNFQNQADELYNKWSGAFFGYVTGNAERFAGSEVKVKDPKDTPAKLQEQARQFDDSTRELFRQYQGTGLFEDAASLITNTPQYTGYEAELWRRTKESIDTKIAIHDYKGAIAVYNEAVKAEQKMNEAWFGKSGIYSVQDETPQQEQKSNEIGTVSQKTETTKTGKTFAY